MARKKVDVIEQEEKTRAKQIATQKRIRMLVAILVIAGAARLFLKDPPKYQEVDYSNLPVRYLPGTLDKLSDDAKAKLSPKMLAKFHEADERARREAEEAEDEWVRTPYQPSDRPSKIQEDIEAYQEQLFKYAERKKRIEKIHRRILIDYSKKTLVQFKKGRFIKVQKAVKRKNHVEILVNRSILVRLPSKMVKSVSENALEWKEPVPKGFIKLKPARGITITVAKKISNRITIKREKYYAL